MVKCLCCPPLLIVGELKGSCDPHTHTENILVLGKACEPYVRRYISVYVVSLLHMSVFVQSCVTFLLCFSFLSNFAIVAQCFIVCCLERRRWECFTSTAQSISGFLSVCPLTERVRGTLSFVVHL